MNLPQEQHNRKQHNKEQQSTGQDNIADMLPLLAFQEMSAGIVLLRSQISDIVKDNAASMFAAIADDLFAELNGDAPREYIIEAFNPAFATLFGEPPDALVGKNLLQYVESRDFDLMADVLSLNFPQTLTVRHLHTDGSPFYAQVQISPIERLTTPEYRYILCTYADITDLMQTNETLSEEKRQLEESVRVKTQDLQEFIDETRDELNRRSKLEADLSRAEKRYRSLAQNFPNGAVILLDKSGRCILAEGTQVESVPIQDDNGVKTLAEPLLSAAEKAVRQAFDGKAHSFEITLGGEPYLISTVPIAAERQSIDAVMLVCQNIVDFKTRQTLEQEREMTALKYNFVTIASHELRTPLAGMMLASGILRRYWRTASEEEKWESVQDILAGLERMSNLLDNILIVGKSDSGKLPFEPFAFDAVQFCRDLVREYEKSLGQSHTTLTEFSAESLEIIADPKLLRLILGNLLSNAYKYSPSRSTVIFRLERDKREGGGILISVQDSGIGIPEEDLPKLFATFHRGKNVGEIQGSGLGLAIVERATTMHGGTISVESVIRKGTTFCVRLPLQPPALAREGESIEKIS
jgi:PAS domain S-box-containing protein